MIKKKCPKYFFSQICVGYWVVFMCPHGRCCICSANYCKFLLISLHLLTVPLWVDCLSPAPFSWLSHTAHNYYYWSPLYSAFLCSWADSLFSCHIWFWMSDCLLFSFLFNSTFFSIQWNGVLVQCYLVIMWLVPHERHKFYPLSLSYPCPANIGWTEILPSTVWASNVCCKCNSRWRNLSLHYLFCAVEEG